MCDCIKKDHIDGLLEDYFCMCHEQGVYIEKNQYYVLRDFVKFMKKDVSER